MAASRSSPMAGVALLLAAACAPLPREQLSPDRFEAGVVPRLDRTDGTPGIRLVGVRRAEVERNVDAAIQVSAPGYAMVLAVDLDGFLEVLYPESPRDSSMVTPDRLTVLSHVFTGFGGDVAAASAASRFANAGRPARVGVSSGRGMVFAYVSDQPLMLGQFTAEDGDWNYDALREALAGASVPSVARGFGDAIAPPGRRVSLYYAPLTRLTSYGAALAGARH